MTTTDRTLGRRSPVVAALFVAAGVAVVAATWLPIARWLGASPSAVTVDVVAGIAELIAIGIGATYSFVAARRHPHHRTAWALIGAGVVAWGAGNVVYLSMVAAGEAPGIPSWADAGYLLSIPLLAAGVFLWPRETPGTRDIGAVIDGLISGSAIVVLLWIAAFHELMTGGQTSVAELVVSLLYPVGDVVIVLMLVAALRRATDASRPQLALLAGGLATITVADLLYSIITITGNTELPAAVVDTPWIVGFTLIAGAAALAAKSWDDWLPTAPAERRPNDPDRFVASIASGLAAVALLSAVVVMALATEIETILTVLSASLLLLVVER
ncbi:MAG: hypothetical protein ACKOYM_00130 [Actinomycetes bacterium]